jgi:N-acetylglucosaminyldiphosphoundecaprenol N-acetyl-beta-D-mannosaminyltransferase
MTDDTREENRKERERPAFYQCHSRTAIWRRKFRWYVRTVSWSVMVKLVSCGKRAFDFIVSAIIVLAVSPVLLVGFFLSGLTLHRTPRLGQWCEVFNELSFSTQKGWGGRFLGRLHLKRLPVLINILKGEMSFVGPLPVSPGELSPQERQVRKRYRVRPGLISLWWIRSRANIDYGTELEADAEYVVHH